MFLLLKQKWVQTIRSVALGRKIATGIFLGFIGFLTLSAILSLGFGLELIVEKEIGTQDVVGYLNTYLLFFFLSEMLYRMMLQKVSAMELEHYLHLPIRRSKIIHFVLLTYLTPDEYFETLRKIYGLSDEDLSIHLEKFSDLFNREIIGTSKYIRDLSKGNLKKVGIASAMLGNKNIVLLDEPFENLDPTSQNRLKKIITEEKEQNQVTYLISSHDLVHVTNVCDRIVLLEKGLIKKDLKAKKEEMTTELNEYFDV